MNLIGKEVVMLYGEYGVITGQKDDMFYIDVSLVGGVANYFCSTDEFNYEEVVSKCLSESLKQVIEDIEEIEDNVDDYHISSQLACAYGKAVDLKNYIEEINN